MTEIVTRLTADARFGSRLKGIYSVCSAHPWVIEASMRQALDDGTPLLLESTSNQVDQYGGYTGMRPADFVRFVHKIADRVGFRRETLLLGGDHLGPNAWRNLPADEAMERAEALIEAYAAAGFKKIHLDTSMSCADDPSRLSDEVVAGRAARLCAAAEQAAERAGLRERPVYIVGTEVPVPGGASEALAAVEVTNPRAALDTVAVHRAAWQARGLDAAWERVVGLVVQPGVEFDHTKVVDYDASSAGELSHILDDLPGMVFEAHSTDYQKPEALSALVRDGFAILKVGPGATFALREALYALADIEDELVAADARSNLRAVVERVMQEKPRNWEKYYHGSEQEKRLLRTFSYSDRIRYYWTDAEVADATQKLVFNLEHVDIRENLISRYLPNQYWQLRCGLIDGSPMSLIFSKVREVIGMYAVACRT
ncbi:D-tagatose-bisphosphate aldolase, class II, non-catalytic subunit [Caballeronia sp. NK8]|uniref:D-tagatose-bisphosphate aldolase, class II, non-catalytic subunit n=1 Tax=Caballeronia sp. NK8 TaxID=140098 RepID=UPI001BB6DA5E|nr:D-tagatose-bisphosphate aldolase, class II, non-catalytic subunit [Caballeronia sp. NK8]BCQ25053.1 D-tagatose-bisphosphate aldolase, class II, non-catalytic subunit [Caballeronia sp. NK8]